ncbi:MAG TPA: TatD family hydrolase [Clostridia bacterium]|nr:TatD family hydrolase [Clostridia bacterium]
MIDTHAHLNFPQLKNQIDKIIAESKKTGVLAIVLAASNLADSIANLKLAQKYPECLFASVGIHPQKTDPENKMPIDEQLQSLEKIILDAKRYPLNPIVAIGETGLDFSEPPPGEEKRTLKDQESLFLGHIKLAQKYNLPLIVHARKATDEVIKILSSRAQRGVFHCYAGGRKRIAKILSLSKDWYFGFDGNLTYDVGLQTIIPLIPEDKLLIETDSPFLAPAPYRGKVNTPANLHFIQEKINEISQKDLTKQILHNTKSLFSRLIKASSRLNS